MDERDLLREAVRLAVANADAGQLPFGALVVHGGNVVATGVNTALRDQDPTAHAEVAAIRAACRTLGTLDLGGATVMSSCEPCVLCHSAAAVARVGRIVYAAAKEDVPDLGYPATLDPTDLLGRMQAAARGLAPEQIVHLPTDGAAEPFRRYRQGRAAA
ncbi:nucleoside deaminase [Allorhizocola rhizosphaerae]|uniref:nucleoside deaminase n=1 Tax=Allorhizocola rhizosphaerae TaxID=1872709 RepID=UPI000E3D072B|nr:nucleoside deaminase [Allorhizocola rhizosphaerae]